jgi:hypothetical protein
MNTAHGTETSQKSRGNTAEIPREVKILAIAWEFRGNGNRNRNLGSVSRGGKFRGIPAEREIFTNQT